MVLVCMKEGEEQGRVSQNKWEKENAEKMCLPRASCKHVCQEWLQIVCKMLLVKGFAYPRNVYFLGFKRVSHKESTTICLRVVLGEARGGIFGPIVALIQHPTLRKPHALQRAWGSTVNISNCVPDLYDPANKVQGFDAIRTEHCRQNCSDCIPALRGTRSQSVRNRMVAGYIVFFGIHGPI